MFAFWLLCVYGSITLRRRVEASVSSLLRTACRPVGEPVTPVYCRPVIYCHLVATVGYCLWTLALTKKIDVSNNEVFWGGWQSCQVDSDLTWLKTSVSLLTSLLIALARPRHVWCNVCWAPFYTLTVKQHVDFSCIIIITSLLLCLSASLWETEQDRRS